VQGKAGNLLLVLVLASEGTVQKGMLGNSGYQSMHGIMVEAMQKSFVQGDGDGWMDGWCMDGRENKRGRGLVWQFVFSYY
jgi:hypothetical protein